MNQRLQNLMHWLQERDIDVAFLTSTPNVFYLSKFYCEPHERLLGLFIFPESEPILICPKNGRAPSTACRLDARSDWIQRY
ncbi:hypothetical protein GCM10020331_031980 [Ectobacillus funiculus]